MIQRIYIDTSVIGGCYDEEFKMWSNLLIREFLPGQKIAIFSDVTIDEVQDAPEYIQNKLGELIKYGHHELIAADREATELVRSYIQEGAVSAKFYEDALHIAMATINKALWFVTYRISSTYYLDNALVLKLQS